MNRKEKILIISAIDSLLFDELDYRDAFSKEERDEILSLGEEVFDSTSPKDIREGMVSLARKLYREITEDTE
jgi:hypothetical protein